MAVSQEPESTPWGFEPGLLTNFFSASAQLPLLHTPAYLGSARTPRSSECREKGRLDSSLGSDVSVRHHSETHRSFRAFPKELQMTKRESDLC